MRVQCALGERAVRVKELGTDALIGTRVGVGTAGGGWCRESLVINGTVPGYLFRWQFGYWYSLGYLRRISAYADNHGTPLGTDKAIDEVIRVFICI